MYGRFDLTGSNQPRGICYNQIVSQLCLEEQAAHLFLMAQMGDRFSGNPKTYKNKCKLRSFKLIFRSHLKFNFSYLMHIYRLFLSTKLVKFEAKDAYRKR